MQRGKNEKSKTTIRCNNDLVNTHLWVRRSAIPEVRHSGDPGVRVGVRVMVRLVLVLGLA